MPSRCAADLPSAVAHGFFDGHFLSEGRFFLATYKTSCAVLLFYTAQEVYKDLGIGRGIAPALNVLIFHY